jgi:hypothetical protein
MDRGFNKGFALVLFGGLLLWAVAALVAWVIGPN